MRPLTTFRILCTFLVNFENCRNFASPFVKVLLDECQFTIIYERRESAQVLYVIHVSSMLGQMPLEGEWEDKIESLYAAVSLQAQAVFNQFLSRNSDRDVLCVCAKVWPGAELNLRWNTLIELGNEW